MEREKSKLRKLKREFWREKKNEEVRQMNRKFQQDPVSLYSDFNKMLAKEPENDRPRAVYDNTVPRQEKHNGAKFANVEEACGFWKE